MKLSEALREVEEIITNYGCKQTFEAWNLIIENLESKLNYEQLQERQGSGERITKEWLRRKIEEDKLDVF